MGEYYLKNQVLAKGKKVSMGIDVDKESWQVTATSEGEELFHGRIPGDYSALTKLLNRFVDCQIRVAYEAGLRQPEYAASIACFPDYKHSFLC